MNDRCECLILSETDYKDNSLLLNVLTKEFGKLSFIASGVKKNTSKNACNILLYTKSEFLFDYKEGKTIFRLKSAKTIDYYRYMHEDLECIAASSLLSEASNAILFQDSDFDLQQEVYLNLEEAYKYLNEKVNTKLILAIYITKLLQDFGSGMEVDSCISCGKTTVSAFSIQDGGFLCSECAAKNHIPLSKPTVLKAIRYVNKAELNQFSLVKENIDIKEIPLDTIISFYETHVGVKLKSFSFYKRFLPLNEAN